MSTESWRICLGDYREMVDTTLAEFEGSHLIKRIWARDYTVWKNDPVEISNRLGWLDAPGDMLAHIERMGDLADEVRESGYTHVLLLGMGGSSLAPEVFRKTFGVAEGYLDLAVLDSTDPARVLAYSKKLNPEKTLFVVSTKSGTTVETLSFFKYFYNRVSDTVGSDRAGEHFIAITDPGSSLKDLASRYSFRETFLNNPDIGGRYSALSFFGLVPAALIGLDVKRLLKGSIIMAERCRSDAPDNPGLLLGAIMGSLAVAGRDKLTLFISPEVAPFGNWVEQLIAESTGKDGTGIVPVVGEPPGSPDVYGLDRFFVSLNLKREGPYGPTVKKLESDGHPVLTIYLKSIYDLGAQFILWEMATTVAGHLLRINPFDQPNVEASKKLARRMVDEYIETGALPPPDGPVRSFEGITVYGETGEGDPGEILRLLLEGAGQDSYVAIQAYLRPEAETDRALRSLSTAIRDRYNLAVTVGYGPRFLHSTGQLHKGDAGRGICIQFTADSADDVPIPEEAGSSASSITFKVLMTAQAMGDRRALMDSGRKVLRLHLGSDIVDGLGRLTDALI